MITGYNTDVRHNDVVYHVQTEDKGLANPFIESLLYVGGQILANKRTSYAELLSDGKGERAVMMLMDHQHRTMIAAIRAGKFDKRLAMLRGEPVEAAPDVAPDLAPDLAPDVVAMALAADETIAAPPSTATLEAPPPFETVGTASDRTLDQVILDYLTNESQQEQLVLGIESEGELRGGRSVRLTVRATSSRSAQPLAGVRIIAKMISTFAGPLTLGDGETDGGGAVVLDVAIPEANRGTAALIVTGSSAIGRSEYKHLL